MIAVIFEVEPAPGQQDRYLDTAAALRPLLDEIEGFVSVERFQSLSHPGKLVSLSFFEDEDAVRRWRENTSHRAAQAAAQQGVFAHYRLRIAHVLRDYSMTDREQAPIDSFQRDH